MKMLQSDLLWFYSTFSQIPVWVWFALSMFLVLLSLHCPFQLLKAACLSESSSTGCGSRNAGESSEEVVDLEAYSSTYEYDVFLSFRGPDTRQGFIDVLYDTMTRAGIRVFRDDDEVSVSQPLQKILHAIETSQICMPIFSRTFAESPWCLREVAKMIELKKLVVPIFYDVTPDDVKLKTGAYRSQLKIHEKKKNGKEQVKVWADALREAAKIKGREVHNTGYTEFCKKLVDEGLRKLKPRKRSYDESLVGIDSQIKSLMKLVDIESTDVRYIGIHGMGGIGKTTLAKSLYKNLSTEFDYTCFLEDVRESSLRSNGLQETRKLLQAELDPEFTRGCNSLRGIDERFWRKKVLIVLDDVNKSEQIEKLAGQSSWFGSGSRIIVTTRNVDVFKKIGKLDQIDEVRLFEMMTLEHGLALELFQWYAFRDEKPPTILETISRKIVSSAGGLPLALKVMGSRLYNIKDETVWREVLERSREVQDKDVKERLRISYDALEDDQKKIFLDIACVPDMKDKVKSVYMWEASKLYPHLNLAVLHSMSLVKFNDAYIWMHDLLRDLGMDIACEDHSRVWKNEEASNVFLNKEGKEKLQVLCLDKPLEMSLTTEHFRTFQKLRFLKLVGTNIEGDSKLLFPKLVWHTWNYCPPTVNITNFYMKNLAVLNMSCSFINESWSGWSIIQNLNNLKELDLSYCHNLTTTPEFSETNRLERLSFNGCSKLCEVHDSVGKLQRLKYLNLEDCDYLSGLPDGIGRLLNLEELWTGSGPIKKAFWWVDTVFTLPILAVYLKPIMVYQRFIMDIPNSIGGLVKLKHLCLYTRAKVLPESLGRLGKLESLSLEGCNNLGELPESLGCLQELKVLTIDPNKIRKLPMSIGNLKKLQEFRFTSICGLLEEVPDELFGLSRLRLLSLCGSSISTLPSKISKLPLLRWLKLDECHQLQELPDLPLGLIGLSVSSKSLQRVPNFSGLLHLKKLKLFNMDDYKWPQRMPKSNIEWTGKLTKLEGLQLGVASATAFDFGSLTQLDYLRLDFQPDIDFVPSLDNNNRQASKLLKLKLPDLSGLKNLFQLSLKNCLIEEDGGVERLGIQQLGNVKRVRVENCGVKLIEQICLMNKLEYLHVTGCGSLGTLANLSQLENLVFLEIKSCKELVGIPGLGNLESLGELQILNCASLEMLENLCKLEKLSWIKLIKCPKISIIEGTDRLSLNNLLIDDCSSLQNVEQLKRISKRGRIDGLEFDNSDMS